MKLAIICVCVLGMLVVVNTRADVTTNDETDISLSVFIPCAAGGIGEVVDLSGPLHTLISATVSNNDVSGKFHFQPQGISGVGEVSGVKYHSGGIIRKTESVEMEIVCCVADCTTV